MSGPKTGTPEAYVARQLCGCVVAVTVNMADHPKDVARDVAEWIRDGLAVEGHSVEAVRAMPFGCKCNPRRPNDQLSLGVEA